MDTDDEKGHRDGDVCGVSGVSLFDKRNMIPIIFAFAFPTATGRATVRCRRDKGLPPVVTPSSDGDQDDGDGLPQPSVFDDL